MKKGTFCISLDTEFLWGRRNMDWRPFIPRAKKTRKIIMEMLKIFDKYDFPATWAIVGKLYEKPDKDKNSNLWHAPDIIREIKKHKNQEIGCHSFTHPEFDKISKSEAREEIKNCIKLAKKENVKLESFVFPKNQVAHLDVLKENNFISYRGPEEDKNKIWQLFDYIFMPPKCAEISKNKGLINIPGTMYYLSSRGKRRYMPVNIRVRRAKRGIDRAIKEKKLFHMWFHPIDLADNTEEMLEGLEKIIKYATEQRHKGKLEIKTMQEIIK